MASCVEVVARTLREAGVTRMFGMPGGEILDFIDAARREGIEFVLTRQEGTAAFMADATGQIQRRPGVCVATLGPGAVNMTLGVANAYLDRSPLIAITASLRKSAEPFTTHQSLDLNAVYRPFTKMTVTLDGQDTAAKVRRAYRASIEPRMGPVHIAIPPDIATASDHQTEDPAAISLEVGRPPAPAADAVQRLARELRLARRPIVILGLDLNPYQDRERVREFVERLGAPVFVTPKAKGMLPEDHPLFFGVCAGVAADWVIVDLFAQADLLLGIGFDPVESDKLWHHTMKLASVAPVSIAAGEYRPYLEVVGDVHQSLAALARDSWGPFDWTDAVFAAYRQRMQDTLQAHHAPRSGVSPYEATRCLRELFPRDTILATDVGAIKSVTSQAWTTFEPLTFLQSNGLSAMSYSFGAAMAAKRLFPERPVLCTIGDGGFGMTLADVETCVRSRIHFVTVVYNDGGLSLIRVVQQSKGLPSCGVDYGPVDFAAICAGLGAWSRRVASIDELRHAVAEARHVDRPVVLDLAIDPTEYRAHNTPVVAERQH